MPIQKKKSLGQHFLHFAHYLQMVVAAAEIQKGERVLEVGPGEGALTAELLARGARVIAVEKDRRLIPLLQEKFAGRNFEVYEADALEFNISNYTDGPYKAVGNIPYYITGALLKKFFSEENRPSLLVFLIQKEVAERIARAKKESILSLSIKAYGEPRYVKTVPAGAFVPPPKVDSAILAVHNISRKNFKDLEQERKFFDLLHKGFGSKRKLLASNLKPLLGERSAELLERAGIQKNARAEDVPLEKWLMLARL
ncbi:ribosomal RNA small subunit methyltransferase A [Candidatus Adlerbacteria bacterium RIFCSPHIGHO2_12_FULL_53_18]|uniref:Ribosomal RNA small subunit methyltransferase A n=2 Tax=Parcubacteria group TaxID=1794811 RepID=A0A1F4XTC4_9BACT|nr:MAG: ribosomal RNA small subunit methyltransferase A [Candidatus Adlerbacteria bacterium RIFCSPHIGHO2_12_FULL_53_18]OGG51558.1 MAG: ribosomal RNA small subunit methyltransferase A [Candidatus Kaiserbacteria bacterium RIFCSPHIGHO2_01_FULL_54_36b]